MCLKLLSIAFTLGLWLFGSASNAQQIDPAYLTISDGLASSTINDALQDSYGLIWIATANGLQKYDGYTFETFKNVPGKSTSLQDNHIWSILEDDNHDIWVGNSLGVSRYNRQTHEFINYDFARQFNFTSDSKIQGIDLLKDSQHRLWVNTVSVQLILYDSVADDWNKAKYEVPNVDEPVHKGFSIGITEDSNGNLWLGSPSYGLMRQAKSEDVFKPISADQQGDLHFEEFENQITDLYADSTDIIWITTRSGVFKYNPEAETFKTIKEYNKYTSDTWNGWNQIQPDPEGNIWIANNYRGILKFDGISDRFQEIEIAVKARVRNQTWNITLTQFMIDRSGIFWFGSREFGLLKYDPVNKPFKHLAHDPANSNSLSPGGIFGILPSQVNPGKVYVGMRGSGLNIYDPQNQTIDKVTFKVEEDMFGGSVRGIAEDKDGSLWLGTWGDGLIELDKNYKEIKRYKYDPSDNTSISDNIVRVIKYDHQGRLWVGTNSGLNIINPKTNTLQRVKTKFTILYPSQLVSELEKLISTDQKVGVIEKVTDYQDISVPVEINNAGTYWVMVVGESDPILGHVDFGWIENADQDTVWQMSEFKDTYYAGGSSKNRIEIRPLILQPGRYTLHYKTDDSHSYGKWNEAAPDQTSLYGIALLKPQSESQLQSFQPEVVPEDDELVMNGVNINDIEVTDKFIWVAASANGLDRIDPVTNHVKHYAHDPHDPNSLSHNEIRDIQQDSHGMIWLATNEGINKFDPDTETFTRYTEEDGLPINLTEGIVEGDDGEMWIATQNGLSQMVANENLGRVTFINYNSSDGLGGDAFLSLASTRAADGQFYFGGDHGLTTFSSIKSNKIPPAIIISNLFISNKSVMDMEENSPLSGSLLDTKSMTLPFDQNSLSFEFAALHYANPSKNQYAHMLKGYDDDWIYDNRNFAAYTNLAPGKYEFLVRASNAYGLWNEKGKSLEIIILPPWWRTWWAYAIYAILFVMLAFTTDRTIRRSIRMRERERSRERELKQAKEIEKAYTELKATQSQLIQAEKMASLGELTAGIAHEIQNPLNFVNNFSEVSKELLDEMKEELNNGNLEDAKEIANDVIQNLEKITHHGKRADSIVKGMLQHSRSSTAIKEPTDINVLVDEYLRLTYHGLRAKDKSFNATLKTNFDDTIGKIEIVPQDIGRVVLNLINNAFYASNQRLAQHKVEVNGNGISIPEEEFKPTVSVSTKKNENQVLISVTDNGSGIPKHVIDKIFQPFFTTKPTGQGTGLGLSLSYDIVKTHGGELKVDTEEGKGTTFFILLPTV